jgi:cystathionine beta-lyase family protein involved in aluminum resistance
LSVKEIGELCALIHARQPDCICFVDNCYGELVQDCEPPEVGADLVAGSLIKNLGGTIAPTGGYVAGRADLVNQACCRLTAPGIGREGGTGFDLQRLVLQGLFLAPQMVAEALIGADLVAGVFERLGFRRSTEARRCAKRLDPGGLFGESGGVENGLPCVSSLFTGGGLSGSSAGRNAWLCQ